MDVPSMFHLAEIRLPHRFLDLLLLSLRHGRYVFSTCKYKSSS